MLLHPNYISNKPTVTKLIIILRMLCTTCAMIHELTLTNKSSKRNSAIRSDHSSYSQFLWFLSSFPIPLTCPFFLTLLVKTVILMSFIFSLYLHSLKDLNYAALNFTFLSSHFDIITELISSIMVLIAEWDQAEQAEMKCVLLLNLSSSHFSFPVWSTNVLNLLLCRYFLSIRGDQWMKLSMCVCIMFISRI